jgi:outer membrane receptor for ferrienterochelin and colicins
MRLYRTDLSVRNTRTQGVTENIPQVLIDDVLDAQARTERGAHALTVGTELRRERLDDSGLPGGTATARHSAVYAQDEWTASPTLSLTTGLRLDEHEQYGTEWSPRVYAVYKPAPHWVVKGGFSHGFKAPNLKQIAPGSRQEGPNTVIGEPDLKPETSHGLELGVGWQHGRAQWEAMAFTQRVRDLIELNLIAPSAIPGIGTYQYANTASARLSGLELSGSLPLNAHWQLGAQYTYLDARDGDGVRLQRRPRHSAGVQLDWRNGPWRAGLALEHTGRQLLPSGRTTAEVPDTTLVSAQVQRELSGGLRLGMGVTNLTNVNLADRSTLFTQAEAPRTWRVTLSQRW